jgi:hypothetical protein
VRTGLVRHLLVWRAQVLLREKGTATLPVDRLGHGGRRCDGGDRQAGGDQPGQSVVSVERCPS